MKRTLLRIAGGLLLGVVALALSGWLYWQGFELDAQARNRAATPADLAFLSTPAAARGRVLAVVSSAARLPNGRRGGYELTELARAYYVLRANGYAVDVASPAGGRPPAVIDDDDMGDADHAFLNDPEAQRLLAGTQRLSTVDPSRYAGVLFVGGKGAMADFPGNADIQRIVAGIDARGGVIAAVCHGPVALVGLRGGDGRPLLAGRRVTGFSNAEELFLIEDARDVFGVLLQERLEADGAHFVEAPMYLDNTVVDGRVVTGQNPWSTWSTAEAMIRVLGHDPVVRAATPEEQAVQVLAQYRREGFDAARRVGTSLPAPDRRLLLMHALVAGMQGHWHDAFQLQRLARR